MAEAVRAAVDAIVDGAQAAPAEVETQAADAPAEAAPAGAPAAPPAPPTEDRRRADLAELQAFARAQANWSREKAELAGAAVAAESKAKAAILAALDSDEPDAALAELGLSVEQRRALASRMVLRHVPEDQAPPELRAKIREDNLRAEVRKLGKEFEQYKKAQDEGRERERQETAARETTRATLETLHEAFRSAGDDAKLVHVEFPIDGAVLQGADPDRRSLGRLDGRDIPFAREDDAEHGRNDNRGGQRESKIPLPRRRPRRLIHRSTPP